MDQHDIFQVLKQQIMSFLPDVNEQDIQMAVKMSDLGANSIDRAEIVVGTMEELNIKIPLVDLGKAKNITDLVNILHHAVNSHEK